MKKCIFCILTVCLILLSGCSPFLEDAMTPMPKDEARQAAITCFEEHKADMEDIIRSGKAMGETSWCYTYSKYSNGKCEFSLHRIGFTGKLTATGVLYMSDDAPASHGYVQDEINPDVYRIELENDIDKYLLERIEPNWFFFYYEYDF
ncbi:MAG: hypothetical protein IKY44_06510 [Clostridia bacterium]|nr:hypothetical protein [Clostridia bacterium]